MRAPRPVVRAAAGPPGLPRDRRRGLSDKSGACEKEVAALKEKLTHVEAASEKVEQDFNEFVRAHIYTGDSEAPAK